MFGHVMDERRLRLTDEKFRAIRYAPNLTDVQELKPSLGLLNCYIRFLHNLSDTLVQKGKQLTWTVSRDRYFELAKRNKLLESGFLAHYDLSLP